MSSIDDQTAALAAPATGASGPPTLAEATRLLARVRGGVEVRPDTHLLDIDIDSLDVFEWLTLLGLDDLEVDDNELQDLLATATVQELYEALAAQR